jgi:hypothetical protein
MLTIFPRVEPTKIPSNSSIVNIVESRNQANKVDKLVGEHLGVGRDHMYSLVTFRIVVPNILGNPPPNASIAIYKTTFDFEMKYVPPK